jgi:hypothetical protein
MVKIVDRSLGGLLLVGSLLHGYGSFLGYAWLTPILVWSLSGSLAGLLLSAINLMRVDRPADRTLAWVSFAGCLAWAATAVGFGVSIGNALDPRPVTHAVVSLGLAGLSLRTALGASVGLRTMHVSGPSD